MAHTIRAVRVNDVSKPMVLEEIPFPEVGLDQVLVGVKAAGVNPTDTYKASGKSRYPIKLPFTAGTDGAGIVEAVGAEVKRFKVGDRVFFTHSKNGAYAEKVSVAETHVGHLHESLSFAQGAAIGIPYLTAFRALQQRAKAQKGETVLIHGASGGVGIAACQVAKMLGLHVVGTGGSEEALAAAREEGHADLVFNHNKEDYVAEIKKGSPPISVILEMLANKNLLKDIELATDFGRIVVIGSRGQVSWDPAALFLKELTVYGMILYHMPPEDLAEGIAFLEKAFAAGTLRPLVGKQYPLAESNEAHSELITPTAPTRGKMILTLP